MRNVPNSQVDADNFFWRLSVIMLEVFSLTCYPYGTFLTELEPKPELITDAPRAGGLCKDLQDPDAGIALRALRRRRTIQKRELCLRPTCLSFYYLLYGLSVVCSTSCFDAFRLSMSDYFLFFRKVCLPQLTLPSNDEPMWCSSLLRLVALIKTIPRYYRCRYNIIWLYRWTALIKTIPRYYRCRYNIIDYGSIDGREKTRSFVRNQEDERYICSDFSNH